MLFTDGCKRAANIENAFFCQQACASRGDCTYFSFSGEGNVCYHCEKKPATRIFDPYAVSGTATCDSVFCSPTSFHAETDTAHWQMSHPPRNSVHSSRDYVFWCACALCALLALPDKCLSHDAMFSGDEIATARYNKGFPGDCERWCTHQVRECRQYSWIPKDISGQCR
ncbi:hypothetical protein NCLIV_038380 [Neospora caninum Liverpool]|uniref:Apple domain-containing protein n=1 Tax=Neospora caninum (strain Liverpool) TaxID=572307 RepID=F0VCD9_NEOCL|nr:hypothetical protein NCLIV_038380 [Neospora caninum Liverpool]CBZ50763.1 hypothetical protein NCLIV_038380 [Neospora caninum Liverpool]CEL68063.1 TPA: hypothetical protein BN1204_038380 [Neospora caninum Liverpool]|eukprot:XP_003880796.1 hypothetical protein NCLIV_038380 [Neospora caninum Liverpool]